MTMKQPARDVSTPSPGPHVVEGEAAFRRDLPDLLTRYRGHWVAYRGKERVEVGKRAEDVYQRCLDRGFREEEFIVLCVEPLASDTILFWRDLFSENLEDTRAEAPAPPAVTPP